MPAWRPRIYDTVGGFGCVEEGLGVAMPAWRPRIYDIVLVVTTERAAWGRNARVEAWYLRLGVCGDDGLALIGRNACVEASYLRQVRATRRHV